MGNCFTHPAFSSARNGRPRSNQSQIVFPWDDDKEEFSTQEWDIANQNHQRLQVDEYEHTMQKLSKSKKWNPDMSRYNLVLWLASLCGCLNCMILLAALTLFINKMISNPGILAAGLILGFITLFCCCSICMYCALKKDTEHLEDRREEFQTILNKENSQRYHQTNRSWQSGPYGSYLKFNLNQRFEEMNMPQQVYQREVDPYQNYPQQQHPQKPVMMSQPYIYPNRGVQMQPVPGQVLITDPGAPVMTTDRSLVYR